MFQNYPFTYGQVSIGSTPTLIVGANASRSGLQVVNTGSTNVYLGDANVTTSTGHLLVGSAGASLGFSTTAAVYGIVATSTETVTYLSTQ